jgi:hypothetical protein
MADRFLASMFGVGNLSTLNRYAEIAVHVRMKQADEIGIAIAFVDRSRYTKGR